MSVAASLGVSLPHAIALQNSAAPIGQRAVHLMKGHRLSVRDLPKPLSSNAFAAATRALSDSPNFMTSTDV